MELARTEQGRGALGHFPTRRYCRQRAQTSVPNVRLPFPYLSKPLSGGYSPSHRWIQMNSLYLEKVSSPTTNWATSRQTHMQETGGEWPTGQLTQRGTETTVKLPPPPVSSLMGEVMHREFQGSLLPSEWWPCPGGALPQLDQFCLGLQNYSLPDKISPWENDLTGNFHLSWTAGSKSA